MQEYDVKDLFNIQFVPIDTPLYYILTGGTGDVKAKGILNYSLQVLSVIRKYIETGVIDIIYPYRNRSSDIDELIDAFQYLLALYKPDDFPVEYWFATLTENWILDEWRKGNTPTDNKWLIDITQMVCKIPELLVEVTNNPDYVVAGSYILSLIDSEVKPNDIDVFYIGEDEGLSAGDDLFVKVRKPYMPEDINTIEEITNTMYEDYMDVYAQYNDGCTICHVPLDESYPSLCAVINKYNTSILQKKGFTTRPYNYPPKWQFVLKKYPSASHILVNFDIDCCKVCLIDDRVYVSPCGYYAIMNKVIKLANSMTGYNSLFRLYKYVKVRGYNVLNISSVKERTEHTKELYSVPETIPKGKYYSKDFTYHELFYLSSLQDEDKCCCYGYGLITEIQEKYRSLRRSSANIEWSSGVSFGFVDTRVIIYFHPSLSSPEEIKSVIRSCNIQNDDIITAIELVDEYTWSIENQTPRESVDFVWYM